MPGGRLFPGLFPSPIRFPPGGKRTHMFDCTVLFLVFRSAPRCAGAALRRRAAPRGSGMVHMFWILVYVLFVYVVGGWW